MEKIMSWLKRRVSNLPTSKASGFGIGVLVSSLLTGCSSIKPESMSFNGAILIPPVAIFFLFSITYLFNYARQLADDYRQVHMHAQVSRMQLWLKDHGQDLVFCTLVVVLVFFFCSQGLAQVRIPGSDESAKLKAAGTLLMLIDTALFVWLARILAGICVFTAGWLIKEQKLGPAIVCVLGALLIGTSPMWVQNIFEIGGGGGVFGK